MACMGNFSNAHFRDFRQVLPCPIKDDSSAKTMSHKRWLKYTKCYTKTILP